jgi:hypothetical protein
MNRLSPFVALLLFAACGDDDPVTPDAGTDTTSQADTATDATGDPTEGDGGADTIDPDAETDADTAPVDTTVTFRLVNENPGGLSRWVQVVDNRGTPGWYNMMPPDSLDEFLRIHDACTICNCDEPDCEECVPEPEIVEIAPGESVTAVWDGTIIDFNQDSFCEEPGQSEETQFQVEFVWSPEPPDETGALPVGTLSRTRLPFELGTDSAVTYELEALADK